MQGRWHGDLNTEEERRRGGRMEGTVFDLESRAERRKTAGEIEREI